MTGNQVLRNVALPTPRRIRFLKLSRRHTTIEREPQPTHHIRSPAPRSASGGWTAASRCRRNGSTSRGQRLVPGFAISESPAYVARGVAALAKDSEKHRFAGQVLTARQLAGQYGVTDTDGSRPDCWGLIAKYGWGDQEPEVIRQYR